MDFLRTSKTGFKKNCSKWLLINALLINNSTGKHLLKVTEKETRITFIDAAPVLYCRLWTDIRPKKQTNPCPKLTIKIKEWWHWSYSGNLINNFEQIPCIVPVYLFLYLFLIYVAVNWLYINKYTNSLNAKIAII